MELYRSDENVERIQWIRENWPDFMAGMVEDYEMLKVCLGETRQVMHNIAQSANLATKWFYQTPRSCGRRKQAGPTYKGKPVTNAVMMSWDFDEIIDIFINEQLKGSQEMRELVDFQFAEWLSLREKEVEELEMSYAHKLSTGVFQVTQGGMIVHDGMLGFVTRPDVLVGGMPAKGKRKKRIGNQGGKPKDVLYGTVTRPPQPSLGTQVKVMRGPKLRFFSRQIKGRVVLATTGTQTGFKLNIYIYSPLQYTNVVASTVTAATAFNSDFNALCGVFQYYRVKRILLEYNHVVVSTVAVPPMIAALGPNYTPVDAGNNFGTNINVDQWNNSVPLDPHKSTSIGYHIPPVSDLAYAGTSVNNELSGGWIGTDVALITRNIADPGIITIQSGDVVLAAPLTTTYGVVEIVYDIDFKLPE